MKETKVKNNEITTYYINLGYGSREEHPCLSPDEIREKLDDIDIRKHVIALYDEYGLEGYPDTFGVRVSRVFDVVSGTFKNVEDHPGTFRCSSNAEITVCSYILSNELDYNEDDIVGNDDEISVSSEKFTEIEEEFGYYDGPEEGGKIVFREFNGTARDWCVKVLGETEEEYDERIKNLDEELLSDMIDEIIMESNININSVIEKIFYYDKDGGRVYPEPHENIID